MTTQVTSGVIATLLEEAARSGTRECCGLLLGKGDLISLARPAVNIHPAPERHFEIDPAALIAAHRAARDGGAELLGYYHSHPNGRPGPSAADRAACSGDGRIWAIVASGAITWWRDLPGGLEPLPLRLGAG